MHRRSHVLSGVDLRMSEHVIIDFVLVETLFQLCRNTHKSPHLFLFDSPRPVRLRINSLLRVNTLKPATRSNEFIRLMGNYSTSTLRPSLPMITSPPKPRSSCSFSSVSFTSK